jgi:hypothetical protein
LSGIASAQVLAPTNGGTGTNTPPTSGQVLVGQPSGDYLPLTASGDCTINSSFVFACSGGSASQFAVDVTQPPYDAACDGSTDDHVAIQTALNENPAVFIPAASGGTTCNVGTVGVTLCASGFLSYNAIYGNGVFLKYSGSGVGVTQSPNCLGWLIDSTFVEIAAASGSPTAFLLGNSTDLGIINNSGDFADTLAEGDYTSIEFLGGQVGVNIHTGNGSVIFGLASAQIRLQGSVFEGTISGTTINSSIAETIIGGNGTGTNTITGGSITIENSAFQSVGLTISGAARVKASNALFNSLTFSGSSVVFNGDAVFSAPGRPAITGTFNGLFSAADSSGVPYTYVNGILAGSFLYSVAGTALPSCTSALAGTQLQVSDATAPTFLGTYTGSGTVTSPVLCNGANWVTY